MQLLNSIMDNLETRTKDLKTSYTERYEKTLPKLKETVDVSSQVSREVQNAVCGR